MIDFQRSIFSRTGRFSTPNEAFSERSMIESFPNIHIYLGYDVRLEHPSMYRRREKRGLKNDRKTCANSTLFGGTVRKHKQRHALCAVSRTSFLSSAVRTRVLPTFLPERSGLPRAMDGPSCCRSPLFSLPRFPSTLCTYVGESSPRRVARDRAARE